MTGLNSRLPRQAWLRIYRITGGLTALSVALSVILTNAIMETFSAGINLQGLAVAIVMPVALGTPTMALLLRKHEQLRNANAQLKRLATIDWLTGRLNRGAFTAELTRRLRRPDMRGALLVIDVDHFKAVNDRHGHDRGDDALRLIADTIARTAGETALLGRLGGEEFGVFLEDADAARTDMVAEAIRRGVAELAFIVEGTRCPLSVSIGGATLTASTDFRTLYRLADDNLYRAKSAGRDCVILDQAA